MFVKKAIILAVGLLVGLSVYAGRPKIGPGYTPGIGDGEGNTTGGGCKTEVTMPIGLPETGTDPSQSSDEPANIVYTFDISADNGAASVNQTHSALEKARDINAACVLIRINGFAGGWDVAENIRQEILDYDKPVTVYVNNMAIPAADFISSGADNIYTRKGSTISQKKSGASKKSSVTNTSAIENNAVLDQQVAASAQSQSTEQYSDDVTMNEILYKAGLGNLTVVQHEAGNAERAIDFLVNPFVVVLVLLLIGFVMRKTALSKLPGPMMYFLAIVLMLYLAPFQVSGLAGSVEILVCIALVISIIVSSRYNMKWLTVCLLITLSFAFSLVRAGDTETLMEYSSFRELLTLPAIPMGIVILGWWLGKMGNRRAVTRQENLSPLSENIPATV